MARRAPAPSTPLAQTTLVERVHEELHRRIADNLLPAGGRLVIARLAAEFGVSQIPVREALARLDAAGLVKFTPRCGYEVAAVPSEAELQRIFEARLVIETGALELGAQRITAAILRDLTAINARIAAGQYGRKFDKLRTFIHLNEEFHMRLLTLADNPYLVGAYRQLGYQQQSFRLNHGRGIPDLVSIVAEHGEIIEALRLSMPTVAREALARHIRGGYERLLETRALPGASDLANLG